MSYSRNDLSDTIVALATAGGVGAIAVVRLSGPKALIIADELFYGKKLSAQASHTVHFGTIRGAENEIIDEVLATLFIAPKSYTRENTVEFSLHGSPYIVQRVIERCLSLGARLARAGEFTLRAFLNGQLDLSQAEAVADLIASSSEASHTLAMQQLRGGISVEIQNLRRDLINFASLIELELDFSEEDVVFADRKELERLINRLRTLISGLSDSFLLGNAIKNGVSTVIAGRPNAGKSTLLNALLQEERAIVSEIAGTTRDTVEEVLNIGGIEFRLIDTAGIREAQDQIEAIGVAKTLEKVRNSAILVYVFDINATKIDEVLLDLSNLGREGLKIIVVCNKMDTQPHYQPSWLLDPSAEEIPPFFFSSPEVWETRNVASVPLAKPQIITLSAKHGMNVPYLKEKLHDLVALGGVNAQSTVVSNARHFEALQNSLASLDDVLSGVRNGVTSDFVAMDIRRSLHHLGSITGEISTDDLLENIFSKFCIGK